MRLRVRSLIALSCCVAAVSCRSTPPSGSCTGREVQLQQRRTLVLGTDLDYTPFAYADRGRQAGLDIEVARAIASELHLKLIVANRTSSSLIPDLLAHRLDVAASGLRDSPSLRGEVCVSEPYARADLGILTTQANPLNIGKAADLDSHRVAVVAGGRAAKWTKENLSGAAVKSVPTQDDLVENLRTGAVDAVVDELVFVKFVEHKTSGEYRVVSEIDTGESFVLAVSNDNGGLVARVNDALARLKRSGKLGEIEEKWLGG